MPPPPPPPPAAATVRRAHVSRVTLCGPAGSPQHARSSLSTAHLCGLWSTWSARRPAGGAAAAGTCPARLARGRGACRAVATRSATQSTPAELWVSPSPKTLVAGRGELDEPLRPTKQRDATPSPHLVQPLLLLQAPSGRPWSARWAGGTLRRSRSGGRGGKRTCCWSPPATGIPSCG